MQVGALGRGLVRAVFATWILAGGFGIALKIQRIAMHPQQLGLEKRIGLLVPEIAFACGMCCVCWFLAIAFQRRPRAVIAFSQALGSFSAILLALAQGYFLASGQPLDYAMFALSLSRASERLGIVASETHWQLASSLIAVLAAILVGPVWIWRWTSRERPRPAAASYSARGRLIAAAISCFSAALCFAFTGYSPARRVERGFARDSVTMLALGFLRAQLPETRYRGAPSRVRKTGASALRPRDGAALRNVVVIVLESTRADATTVYDPKLPTTPFLERFARESVIVDRAYAVVPHTTKALVAILCGFEPEVTLSTIESQPGGLPGRCLPSLLGAQGYDTAFFQAPTGRFEDRKRLAENLGFATFVSGDEAPQHGFEKINYFGFEDSIVLNPSEAWLRTRGSRPFMVAYLTSASHHPYAVPKRRRAQQFSPERQRNKYLNAINYGDEVVERVIDQYRRLSLLENTVFAIVGDHGEGFGEHGLWVHDDVVFEEALRVPLMFRLPNAERAGHHVSGPVSELTIVPSLISLAGFEPRDAEYEQGSLLERPAQPVLYAHCYRSDRCAALLRDPLKLLHHFEERPAELYDLAKDPGEENDISDDHPELVEAWSRELADVRLSVHATYREASERALSRFVSATPQPVPRRIDARFGDYLTLLGIRPPPDKVLGELGKAGGVRFYMSYFFHVERQIPAGFTLRLQLRGDGGSITDQHNPLRGLLPLEDFPAGKYVEDAHRVSLPDNWRSPTMTLCLSLVDDRGAPVSVTMRGQPAGPCAPVLTLTVHAR
jgi:lipoteichoic acid synthase